MVSDIIFPFGHLNLASLSPKKSSKVIKKTGLMLTELVEIFEYEKNKNGYWDETKLHQQVVNKALLITETFYPGYWVLFPFDNATNYLIYAKDKLQVKNLNKCIRGQQPQLYNKQFNYNNIQVDQSMNF